MTIIEYFEQQLRDAKISEGWREAFSALASALLHDVMKVSMVDDLIAADKATPADHKESKAALRRISKVSDVLQTRMSPSVQRGSEVHTIMHLLRHITVATADDMYEMQIDTPEEFKCVIAETQPSDRVEMMQEPESDSHPLTEAARQYYKAMREDPYFGSLYEEAEKHWNPQATLQSLVVNIYLDRHGHVEESDRARWSETLRRDLRYMREAKLTIVPIQNPLGECKDTSNICTP